jgi:hypothetical protein
MKLTILRIVLPAALLCGCEARQMNLRSPDLGIAAQRRRPVTEEDIQKAFGQRPTIKPDSIIGIACIEQDTESLAMVRALSIDESKSWQAVFQDEYLVAEIVSLSSPSAPSARDMRLLRKNAATLNCDLLLVYGVTCDYSRRPNPLSVLYVTVIGAFFVPGDSITAASRARAALLDVRTGHVYGTVEGTATENTVMPLVWINGSLPQIYRRCSSRALKDAREKLRPIIERLRGENVQITD